MKIFISYAHEDESWKELFEKHLAPLRRREGVEVWSDRRMLLGEELDSSIDRSLAESDLIILLISAHYLDSDYCWDVEAKAALKMRKAGRAEVIPVILKECDWQATEIAKLLGPNDNQALLASPDVDTAMANAARGIRRVVDERGFGTLKPAPAFVRRPVVPCLDRGQSGEYVAATLPETMTTNLPAATANQLVFYGSGIGVVLAPRGMHGTGWFGSSGISLEIQAPKGNYSSQASEEFVRLRLWSGSTSGRTGVFRYGSRFFESVNQKRDEYSLEFPGQVEATMTHYSADSYTLVRPTTIRFATPSNVEGIAGASPFGVNGVIALVPSPHPLPDLQTLVVALQDQQLADAIVDDFVEHRLRS